MKKYSTVPPKEKALSIADWLSEKKGQHLLLLDVSGYANALTDIICLVTASSARHAQGLSDFVIDKCREEKFERFHVEGYDVAQWILLDLNDIVVHIFQEDTRNLFRIEDLWITAPALLDKRPGGQTVRQTAGQPGGTIMAGSLVPTVLLILDGWGLAPPGPGNAVSLAHSPVLHRLLQHPSQAALQCCGRAVGLPEGYMGNSEVGHMNIGAGRVVFQDITRIDMAIEENRFASAAAVSDVLSRTRQSGGVLHLMGLLSDGGVHSHIRHLLALLEAAEANGVPAAVHAVLDGRDTGQHMGRDFIAQLLPHLTGNARLASLTGRYYTMDRDKRWERIQLAYDAYTSGQGERVADPVAAIEAAYAQGETDEFVKPRLICPGGQTPLTIQDGDGLFFFNFRADRARQIVRAFYADDFQEFDRKARPALCGLATMTPYDAALPLPAAFVRQDLSSPLGKIVSDMGGRQLRVAETEKYAHVTYFFNGGVEEPFPGEDRILIPSPRDVATYDLKPEMSAAQVTDALIEAWNTGVYDLVVCNLANMDMVGHTGIIPATVKACETVDACVRRIQQAVAAGGGRLLVTADHGNADEMLTADGQPQTAHSTNLVPFILLQEEGGPPGTLRPNGKLGDIAPTILHLWGVQPPEVMTGQSLWEEQ